MTTEATDHRERISKILLFLGVIPSGCLGVGLTLGGCCLGAGWLVALARGASAAELPDPVAILYPILMIAAGVVMLSIAGVFLAIRRRLRRAQ
jgi:hypothetical protein